jgi:hypothetical protein
MATKSSSKPTSSKKEGSKKNKKVGQDKLAPETESKLAASAETEELEEEIEEGEASKTQGGNAAALAAVTTGPTELSASFKNFRHHPDMENFYRFIFENDLRVEALAIVDEIMREKLQKRLAKGPLKTP